MAATIEAARLTEAHRLAQTRIGMQVVLLMHAAWPLLDLADLDATFERWLQVVTPIVGSQHQASSTLAANYVAAFRSLELGVTPSALQPVLAEDVDPQQLATSMLLMGPARVRANLATNVPITKAAAIGEASTAGAAMRHALNGGRDTIVRTVHSDSKALGWARATSRKACSFCAMLASRGPVYRQGTANFHAHDHCSCSAEPVYRHDAEWPVGGRRYQTLWEESTAGLSGDDARNAFRQALASA